uniref:RNA-dependent RNA polymerase n=1 Tax=Operophtera brumata cypovirus 19 TaxID=352246 RepID=Q30C69_9REOV|nr:unknown [Operophtera brumata cypovirus 19]
MTSLEHLTPESIATLEDISYNLTTDYNLQFDFLFSNHLAYPEHDEAIKQIIIPRELTSPKAFTYLDYPLNPQRTMMSDDHKYDYLTTFRVGSFLDADTQSGATKSISDDLRFNAIREMLSYLQCQTRYATIWRMLTGAVLNAILEGKKLYPALVSHVLTTLIGERAFKAKEFPFLEQNNGFHFVNMDICSCLPSLCYALFHLGFEYGVENIDDAGLITCINTYLDFARISYGDAKLAAKSAARDWFKEGLSNLGKQVIPRWDGHNNIFGYQTRDLKECDYVTKEFVEERKKREKLPKALQSHINDVGLKQKKLRDVFHAHLVARVASDDGTYYKSRLELIFRKANYPNLFERPVVAPIEVKKLDDIGPIMFTYEDELLRSIRDNFQCYMDKLVPLMSNVNMDSEYVDALKMTSAGVKNLESEFVTGTERIAIRLLKKRLPQAASKADQYREMDEYLKQISTTTYALMRYQIDRRVRLISGVNNEKLLSSLGISLILSKFLSLTTAAALGKQTGTATDISSMLVWSTLPNTLLSSADVKAMDASIQALLRLMIFSFCLDVSKGFNVTAVGPFQSQQFRLYDLALKQYDAEETEVSALTQLLMYEMYAMQTSVTLETSTFGEIPAPEASFQSGLLYTSSHHTSLLAMSNRSGETMYHAIEPSTRAEPEVLGDDVRKGYNGLLPHMIANVERDQKICAQLGLTIEENLSKNSVVFLQQQVSVGCYVGYPDRIGVGTKEHNNEQTSVLQHIQELNALTNDAVWRVRNVAALKKFGLALAMMCANRFTIAVPMESSVEMASSFRALGLRVSVPPAKPWLVTVYLPFMWFFLHKGGEMPCPSIQRRDGSFTISESIHCPTGEFKRKIPFDLSNIRSMITEGKMSYDTEWLTKLGVIRALRLIECDVVGREHEIKRETIDTAYIKGLSRRLEGIAGAESFNTSREAANDLRRHGFVAPAAIIYGEKLTERVMQAAETMPLRKSQMHLFSTSLIDSLRRNKYYQPQVYRTDVNFGLVFNYVDGSMISDKFIEFLRHDIPIAYNQYYGSESTELLAYVGFQDNLSNRARMDLRLTRGIHGHFRFDDPTFQFGFKIWSSRRDLMSTFFIMIQASFDLQARYHAAFSTYSMYRENQFQMSLAPRNLFFARDDSSEIAHAFVHKPEEKWSPLEQSLMYAEVLRNCGQHMMRVIDYEMIGALKEKFISVDQDQV